MKYFQQYFPDADFRSGGEVKVLCPFHDDHVPTASINVEESLFHCFSCKVGYNEIQFASKVNGISMKDAMKLMEYDGKTEVPFSDVEQAQLWSSEPFLKEVEKLGLSRKTINDLKLGLRKDEKGRMFLAIPVFYDNVLVDVRNYNLLKLKEAPKMRSEKGAEVGFVFPYDIWKNDTRTTYLFEGEKDAMLGRELGLNAISLTGGAGALPNSFVSGQFKDRDVVICYDNDQAGEDGRNRIYADLKGLVKNITYVDISELVDENKADFWDAMQKYSIEEFLSLPKKTLNIKKQKKKTTSLGDALVKNIVRKKLTAVVSVSGEFQDSYAVPNAVRLYKKEYASDKDTMFPGQEVFWFHEEWRGDQMLELIESDAKQKQVFDKLKAYTGVPLKEKKIGMEVLDYSTVYKVRVLDEHSMKETEELSSLMVDMYSFVPMQVGRKYEVTYRVYPHPTKHQKLVAVASKVVDLSSNQDFTPDKELLDHFRSEGTIDEQVRRQYKSAKHYVAKHLKFFLWFMIDLVFNSVLEFDYGDRIRGALDVFILGDTQVGKSETSSKLTELYEFGHFLSLKTSTTVGLIGGSNKVDNNWLNTIGAIPRQHKKLVVMEEFSGAKPEFIKTMTDIRSSGRLRLARAAGELDVPAMLRMITISNPINDENGSPRFLSTFPNGVMPIMELVKSAEDVARYDGFLLVQKPTERINPFSLKLDGEKIPKEAYEHKAQWVYTRKPEDVVFEDDSDSYIWEKSQDLNKDFESNFPLFGTTTPLKLARFSVALATMLVNTDESYEKVIVTKEIVDYIVAYFYKIYENDIFKLHAYKEEYDSYSDVKPEDLRKLKGIYPKNATMLDFLMSQSVTSRMNLKTISGMDNDQFSAVFNTITKHKFIKISGDSVYPTAKFRKAMKKVQGGFRVDTGSMIDSEAGSLKMKGDY